MRRRTPSISLKIEVGGDDDADGDPQTIDWLIDSMAPGESVTITVRYIAAPFLPTESPQFEATDGSEFRFLFVNEYLLEGFAKGTVKLYDPDGNLVDTDTGDTKNDHFFDPPPVDGADNLGFLMHLSCSDAFMGGYGQTDGPNESRDTEWQIAFSSINRFKGGEFFRGCGNVVNNFDVDNTATVVGTPPLGDDVTAEDSATVTIKPGIAIEKVRPKGKHVHVDLINYTDEVKTITAVTVFWPDDNGDLAKIRLDGSMIWSGPGTWDDQSGVRIDDLVGGSALILEKENRETLRLEFAKKAEKTGYSILLEFSDLTTMQFTL